MVNRLYGEHMKKPQEPKLTGTSRSYDYHKRKKYEAELKKWEKEQAKKGIQNDAAVKAAQKKQASAEKRVSELTSISGLDVGDALEYQAKHSSKKFKFENVVDDIKVNANNIYEQRRKDKPPGKVGSRSKAGGYTELKNRIETIARESGINPGPLYDGSQFMGGTIGKNETLRIRKGIQRADSDNDFEPVDTSKDVYGVQSIADLTKEYTATPKNLVSKAASVLETINRSEKRMGAGQAASRIKAKLPGVSKPVYENLGKIGL